MNKKTKFGFSHISKPTPANLVKLGNGLVAAATFGATMAVVGDCKILAMVILGMGMLGKVLTAMFTEEHSNLPEE